MSIREDLRNHRPRPRIVFLSVLGCRLVDKIGLVGFVEFVTNNVHDRNIWRCRSALSSYLWHLRHLLFFYYFFPKEDFDVTRSRVSASITSQFLVVVVVCWCCSSVLSVRGSLSVPNWHVSVVGCWLALCVVAQYFHCRCPILIFC